MGCERTGRAHCYRSSFWRRIDSTPSPAVLSSPELAVLSSPSLSSSLSPSADVSARFSLSMDFLTPVFGMRHVPYHWDVRLNVKPGGYATMEIERRYACWFYEQTAVSEKLRA